MLQKHPTEFPEFFTSTCHNWQPLLQEDSYKRIITDAIAFMVGQHIVKVYSFVVMSNHIHIIWQPCHGKCLQQIRESFRKHTSKIILHKLRAEHHPLLAALQVDKYDRKYQVWKRGPLSIQIYSHKVFLQKCNYIHYNPVKAGLCGSPEEYHFSSAHFYAGGGTHANFLEIYR